MTSRLEQLQEMLKSEPNNSFLNYALALEYSKSGEIKKAIEILETLIMRDENYLGAYYQLGKLFEMEYAISQANETYKKGIAIARKQNNKKALGELNEALMMLEE